MKKSTKIACFAFAGAMLATMPLALVGCGDSATHVSDAEALADAVAKGGSVVLDSDITLTEPIQISKNVVLDLNGKNVTETMTYTEDENSVLSCFYINDGGNLTVKGAGTITSDDLYIFDLVGSSKDTDAKVTIENGTYQSDCSIVQVVFGKAYVKGGVYSIENEASYGATYLLNKIDDNVDVTVIEVTGGTFTAFNPKNNAAEGAGTNFVAEGYTVEETQNDAGEKVYTVKKA